MKWFSWLLLVVFASCIPIAYIYGYHTASSETLEASMRANLQAEIINATVASQAICCLHNGSNNSAKDYLEKVLQMHLTKADGLLKQGIHPFFPIEYSQRLALENGRNALQAENKAASVQLIDQVVHEIDSTSTK